MGVARGEAGPLFPLIPAEAGTQCFGLQAGGWLGGCFQRQSVRLSLGPRLRGDERGVGQSARFGPAPTCSMPSRAAISICFCRSA
ncbi:hypothetical protein D3C71_517030 [compost metagenome]